jgi:hypothetical protein
MKTPFNILKVAIAITIFSAVMYVFYDNMRNKEPEFDANKELNFLLINKDTSQTK